MKIAFIIGTRPEIIKMGPLIKEARRRGIPFSLIHSNQHYSYDMDEIFFTELGLPPADFNLKVGSGGHANQTGNILIKLEPVLEAVAPNVVLAQGDTNTTLAAGLAAAKLTSRLGHVEAGLRSYDRTMPEETNRVVVDHLSDYLFAVTDRQRRILLDESIAAEAIHVVGNTVVDALRQSIETSDRRSAILDRLGLGTKRFFLATIHRSANVDHAETLREVLNVLAAIVKRHGLDVVWPIHPRTLKKVDEFRMTIPAGVKTGAPLGYFDFLKLEKEALCIVTDSGGLQEEACVLNVPCITLRENTERPETVEVGANILVGRDSEKALAAIDALLEKGGGWDQPYGDGHTALKILDILEKDFR